MKILLHLAFIASLCYSCSNKKEKIPLEAPAPVTRAVATPKVKLFNIKSGIVELRSGPGRQYKKVMNEESLKTLKSAYFVSIDSTVKFTQDEVNGDWSRITVVQPDSLTETHQGWMMTWRLTSKAPTVVKEADKVVKISTFNDPAELKKILSQNGIGPINHWRQDAMGYVAFSFYFPFGSPSSVNGMQNNVAYYLQSKEKDYAESLKLILNINNSKETSDALEEFSNLASKTFKSIYLNTPNNLLKLISKGEEFNYSTDSYQVKLEFVKNKIDTWRLIINTK